MYTCTFILYKYFIILDTFYNEYHEINDFKSFNVNVIKNLFISIK